MLCLKSYAFNCHLEIIYGQLFSCQCWKYTFAVVLIAILNNFFPVWFVPGHVYRVIKCFFFMRLSKVLLQLFCTLFLGLLIDYMLILGMHNLWF